MPSALEIAVGRLLVAAHVRLENRALWLDGRMLRDIERVQRIRVARHHVRTARVTGRERPHDVAQRADDVRLDLAQPRVAGDPFLVALVQPTPHLGDVRVEEAREPHRLLRIATDEARRARDISASRPNGSSSSYSPSSSSSGPTTATGITAAPVSIS